MNTALSAFENSETFEDRVFEFLELSQKILTLVKHENSILGSLGCLTMEDYLERRNTLLKSYEQNAKLLVEEMISESIHIDAKNLLTSELSSVQAALTENSAYGFNTIQNSHSLNNGERKCH